MTEHEQAAVLGRRIDEDRGRKTRLESETAIARRVGAKAKSRQPCSFSGDSTTLQRVRCN